jgi:ADP-ribose pyrophosphatase YjhB (NUDIX family)|tara:strand:- start:308 stop:736 length:429 start_codon:yes stop_codon:yes gene_type:complete
MKRASEVDYTKFRKYFTFSCVDLLIFRNDNSILLTKRTINPFKGYWHLPGTIIRRNETRKNAVKRAAKEELGKEIMIKEELGIYESIVSFRHDISNAFLVKFKNTKNIEIDFQSNEYQYFKKLPSKIPVHHKKMIIDARKNL